MAIGDEVGLKAGQAVTADIPAALDSIAADVKLATDTIREVADGLTATAIPAFADGISQILQNFSRLDDAIIVVGPISLTLTIPAFHVRVSAPMKPIEEKEGKQNGKYL